MRCHHFMENAAAFRRKLMTVNVKNVKMELYVPEAYVEPIRGGAGADRCMPGR